MVKELLELYGAGPPYSSHSRGRSTEDAAPGIRDTSKVVFRVQSDFLLVQSNDCDEHIEGTFADGLYPGFASKAVHRLTLRDGELLPVRGDKGVGRFSDAHLDFVDVV